MDIQRKLEEVTDLISLPAVYLKIRALVESETSDVHDLADVIRTDPNLSVRVLKLVNTAYFGFPQQIDNISQAVGLIGVVQLHNLVLGLSAIKSLELPNNQVSLEQFWRRSLYAGVLAQTIAAHQKSSAREYLFLAGLLHEIGHLVMYAKFSREMNQILESGDQASRPQHELETEMLGVHYGDIGSILMQKWNLPSRLAYITRFHPDPRVCAEYRYESIVVHITHHCARFRSQNGGEINFLESVGTLSDLLAAIDLAPEELESVLGQADVLSCELEKVILTGNPTT